MQAIKATAVSVFAQDMLTLMDPKNARGHVVTGEELMRWVDGEATRRFASQPDIEADVRHKAGQEFLAFGNFNAAEPQFARAVQLRRAVHAPQSDILASMESWAESLREQGRLDEATKICHELVDERSKALGKQHTDTLAARSTLARILHDSDRCPDAQATAEEALSDAARAHLPIDHPVVLTLQATLALVLRDEGRTLELQGNPIESSRLLQRAWICANKRLPRVSASITTTTPIPFNPSTTWPRSTA